MTRLSLLATATLALTFILPSSFVADSADAGAGTIQPGDLVNTSTGQCTLNFVFDGVGVNAGKVYMGVAAHCTSSVGQSASTSGVSSFGTVAFRGDPDVSARDYAFIQVAAAHVAKVTPEVRGHAGMPTGSTVSSGTATGDLVMFSGYGLGFATTAQTREERVGVLYSDTSSIYVVEGTIIFGDSGGPVLHESGKALGIVSSINAGCCTGPGVWNQGPTVQGILADASAHGFPVAMRSV